MSDISLASAFAAQSQAKVQMAAAAKIAKMNVNAERAVADLVQASAQNLEKIVSSTAPGVGGNLDISV